MITELEGLKALGFSTLFMTALVFGFLPGAALRTIVKLLPKDDPRRAELIAELYTIPRWERLLWVAQQVELCLFEGLEVRMTRRRARATSLRLILDHPMMATLAALKIQPGERVRLNTDGRLTFIDQWGEEEYALFVDKTFGHSRMQLFSDEIDWAGEVWVVVKVDRRGRPRLKRVDL